MLSLNFYYRLRYLIKKKSNIQVILSFLTDRLKHPFLKSKKKHERLMHQNYLKNKKISTDYFSTNAYYWKNIIKKYFKKFTYLEIGSWEGNSALFVLKNLNPTKVICVDVWEDEKLSQMQKRNYNNFKINLDEFQEKMSMYKGSSDDYFSKCEEKFDVIYIDGAHETEQVYKDINNSWKVLNKNGLIICDDFFYGNLYGVPENVPSIAINKFIIENKKKIKIICVNNAQIFFKKISD